MPSNAPPRPSCPPRERPSFGSRRPADPGDRRADRRASSPPGLQEGLGGGGSWVFLFKIEWVHPAPGAGLGGESGFGFRGGGRRLVRPMYWEWGWRTRLGVPSARHEGGRGGGVRWRGREGSPCLGSVTLGHLTPRLPGRVHPIWPPGVRAGMVLGSRGGGGTWHPQLSVLGTAQRKTVSRWEIPSTAPPGAGANLPLPGPPPSLQAHVDCTWSVRPLLLGAQLRGTSLAVPHFGGR